MSVNAISWAFEQDIHPATAKFVLVCLCDNVGMSNKVFPSLDTLCRKTSQDRKTVIASLDRLCELGLLQEVGHKPGGVKEYQVMGLPDGNTHYVYKLTAIDSDDFYIGVRSCYLDAKNDMYFGSGRWPQTIGKHNLQKEILGVFDTRKEAELAESYFLNTYKNSPFIKNKFFPRANQIPSNSPVPKTPLVPKTEPVPKTPLGSTKNGTPPSTENGTQNRDIESSINIDRTQKEIPSISNEEKTKPLKNKKSVMTLAPETFEVTTEMFDWASEQGFPEDKLRFETEHFLDDRKSKGIRYADWKLGWKNWIRKSMTFNNYKKTA